MINNLPGKEFKAILIRIQLSELGKIIGGQTTNFNKEIENIKRNHSELKDTITEIKNTLRGNGRLGVIENI